MHPYLLASALAAVPAPATSARQAAMAGMTLPMPGDDPPASASAMPGMTMPGTAMPADPAGMAMPMGDGLSSPGSGTARLPATDRIAGVMGRRGGWSLMAHGYAWGSWTDGGGPRGAREAFVQSMAMAEASRALSPTLGLTLRAMLSADPLMGKRGYPNLFATGETAHGLALVDRQHPHDLFMELSGRLDLGAGAGGHPFLYAGLPAEPALGPSAFMHRGSARFDPEAPITHHWFDSTHISWGVVTAGWAAPHWQLEGSAFRGREPGEDRWNIETPRLDSWSARATWNPVPAVSAEISYGALHSPEALHPEEDERRLIASVSYSAHGLDATLAWSRKDVRPGRVLPAWLAEATWAITPHHALFGRAERVRNDELFEREEQLGEPAPLAGRPFTATKLTAGYAYTLPLGRSLALALGGAASAYPKPAALDTAYGRRPHTLTLFAKLMLGR